MTSEGRWPSSRPGDGRHHARRRRFTNGLTVNSFIRCRFDPPLVLWSLAQRREPRRFSHLRALPGACACGNPARRPRSVFATAAPTNSPATLWRRMPRVAVLEGCVAWFECGNGASTTKRPRDHGRTHRRVCNSWRRTAQFFTTAATCAGSKSASCRARCAHPGSKMAAGSGYLAVDCAGFSGLPRRYSVLDALERTCAQLPVNVLEVTLSGTRRAHGSPLRIEN